MSVIVSQLSKQYGSQKALDQISFEVKPGEILGFLGPNGAGKSTTMKITTGYVSPTEGKVEVCGFDVRKASMSVRKNIGYLPEHNPLYLDMYVQEYLRFIGRLHKIRGKNLKIRLNDIIERCGLGREQHKKIGQLSKGYRQRVGLAQALIHDPPVLILDEPTTGLDPNQIVEIRKLIQTVGQEKTVIFSTHIMQEVQAICDRAIIIHLGKIVANNSVAELKSLQKNENSSLVEYEQAIDMKALEALEGVRKVEDQGENKYRIFSEADQDIRNKVFKLSAERDWALVGLQKEESSLESIFEELTREA